MKKPKNSISYFTSLLTLLVAGSVFAAFSSQASEHSVGYQYDLSGNVAHKANGECVRTSKWSPKVAIKECDPDIVAKRKDMVPVREKKGKLTGGVATQVDLLLLQAGEAFAFNSDKLSGAGKEQLAVALALHADDYIHRASVAGYTDKIGNRGYNMKLSQRRADAVRAELIKLGLPEERIRVSAHGSDDPLVSCPDMAGKALISCLAPNRRTEVRFFIPKVRTAAAAEFVERRRSDEIKDKNISAKGVVVDSPIINRGVNAAVKIIGDGCSKEIANYCGYVMIGNNRILKCLTGHSDKLSNGCVASIAKAKSTIDAALGDANFFGAKCAPDVKLLCSDVPAGQGRLLACLIGKKNNVTMRCYNAMSELNLVSDRLVSP
jgi:OOP family OmpA-OmpF porin